MTIYNGDKGIGLYVHIPFCRSKCHYCDFNSYAGKEALISPYFDMLKREIACHADRLEDRPVKTVFIGGGTPSVADATYVYELLNMSRRCFIVRDDAEITIECNPGTLCKEKLKKYREAGINRLSIGLQAWQDRLLKMTGRIHTAKDFLESFGMAEKAGFENINVDLIFGLPGQTLENWQESLANVARLGPTHISCYSLKIEEGTPFERMLASGEIEYPDEELDRRMYGFAIEMLRENGFRHYEISNFARPGFECRHSMIYWKGEEYLGVGAGAHSFLDGKRSGNVSAVEEYISAVNKGLPPVEDEEIVDENGKMAEFMILGLRLTDGVSAREFESRFGADIFCLYAAKIEKLIAQHLLEIDGDRIKLTEKGLDLANKVFVEFI